MGPSRYDALILGGGPAGAAAALRLRALGVEVALATRPRRGGVEGLSERALEWLAREHLERAAAVARGPIVRAAHWGSTAAQAGREWLVERSEFDAALLADLKAAGVPLLPLATTFERQDSGYLLTCADGSSAAGRCLVDARGRRGGRAALRGPRLLSLAYRFRAAAPAGTWLLPWADGWCWCASDGASDLYLQIVSSPQHCRSMGAQRLLQQAAQAIPQLAALLENAQPQGLPAAAAATAQALLPQDTTVVRAGDAAVALDPLSGQGIYSALGSAAMAAAAVHTLLGDGEAEAVLEFQRNRTHELWQQTAATAAGYYRANAQRFGEGFWGDTARAYENIGAGAAREDRRAPHIELRAVLDGARIERRRVVVTPARPRGLWRYRSVELAPLADALAMAPATHVNELARRLRQAPADVAAAAHWLVQQRLVPDIAIGEEKAHAA